MKSNKISILLSGLFLILTGLWAYPRIVQLFKAGGYLDKNARWNYEIKESDFECLKGQAVSQKSDSSNCYNQPADEQKRKPYSISVYSADLESISIYKPEKSFIINPTIDTTDLFKIWTLDPVIPPHK
ncbi:hypothetical protein [Persicobacter diffluens]|uniref:Uncharacterized protein n=1 Tax=Persicobacter diffluens TaxID=981 RepID=A0AAN4VV83_9BACT|nr:hypothetical protein PEDI_13010 [Persicobacter diffluens]